MKQLSWFERNSKKVIVIIFVVFFLVSLIVIDFSLKFFLPFVGGYTIGHLSSPNAKLYGWGYNPHQMVRIMNPDTRVIYVDKVNSRGWRDKERSFLNQNNSFRILVLGDSVTFGATVPGDKIYTRILENKLITEGYNVDVINISYGGWNTEQELEALKNEGVLYKPNLIICQFCDNDLGGLYCSGGKIKYDDINSLAVMPFYYGFDKENNLIKYRNEFYYNVYLKHPRIRIKLIIGYSEILKRLYFLYLHNKMDLYNYQLHSTTYEVNSNKILRYRLAFKLSEEDISVSELRSYSNKSILFAELKKILTTNINSIDIEKALRIFEKRWFDGYWDERNFWGEQVNPDKCEWKLYFALMKEIQKESKRLNADLAILSDNNVSLYNWNVYWGRKEASDRAKKNYLAVSDSINKFCSKNGIYFINNYYEVDRSRNDYHPNIKGNIAMANNIYRFLMEKYYYELENYRRIKNKL